MPISNFQPIKLFDPGCWYKFTYRITNCADSGQWLLQKPTDLDQHCLQRQGISGFSSSRVPSKNGCSLFDIKTSILFSQSHDKILNMLIHSRTCHYFIKSQTSVFSLDLIQRLCVSRAWLHFLDCHGQKWGDSVLPKALVGGPRDPPPPPPWKLLHSSDFL